MVGFGSTGFAKKHSIRYALTFCSAGFGFGSAGRHGVRSGEPWAY